MGWIQDVAVGLVALAGVIVLVRRSIGAFRPKLDPKCDHCALGQAALDHAVNDQRKHEGVEGMKET
jgi:hypothetical protein